jgi:hypothetical protein
MIAVAGTTPQLSRSHSEKGRKESHSTRKRAVCLVSVQAGPQFKQHAVWCK